jgi:hypothetical protein
MEQRRLRLGDILDDYCPRERRVTNHAVVAMIEEDVKQTRCTTCDAEHAYKGGKAPRKRKKDTPAALYNEVLAGMSDEPTPHLIDPDAPADTPAAGEPEPTMAEHEEFAADAQAAPDPEPVSGDEDRDAPHAAEEGPVHRPLIRATLPRPEGQKDARPLPEFTVRHSGNRAGNGSFREARGNRAGNSARGHGGHRFGGPRGNGRGPGGRSAGAGGFRSQHPRHGGSGGKKRSR